MSKRPWFKFYPGDWLSNRRVSLMTPAQKGVYIDLLSLCWREGSIPSDQNELAFLLRLPRRSFSPLWDAVRQHFEPTSDPLFLTNRRIEHERGEADVKSKNGRNAANTRWSDDADALQTQSDRIENALPQKEKEKEKEKEKRISPARVKGPDQLWLEAVGLQPGSGLLDAWMLAKNAAPAKGLSPEEYFSKALGVFVQWVDGVRGARRPQKSPQKFVEHFPRIQEILDGKREAVPAETPLPPRVHEPQQPEYEDLEDIMRRTTGGVV